jgi:hypothetical protein
MSVTRVASRLATPRTAIASVNQAFEPVHVSVWVNVS